MTVAVSGGFSDEIQVREAKLVRKGLRNLPLGREIKAHQYRAQAFARAFMLGQSRAKVVLGDEARLNQALT